MDTPVQCQNTIQTMAITIHCRSAYPGTTMKQTYDVIPGMYRTIYAIDLCTDIPHIMSTEEIRKAVLEDEHPSALAELILHNWPSTKP